MVGLLWRSGRQAPRSKEPELSPLRAGLLKKNTAGEAKRRAGGPPVRAATTRGDTSFAVKLVVNSHVKYEKAVGVLFTSLELHGFRRFPNVLVFAGGAVVDTEPYPYPGKWGRRGVMRVNMTLNAHDHNGMAGLYIHRFNPVVMADVYLYIHDTCTVGATFPAKFDELTVVGHEELWIPVRPHSDIYAFGHGVVEKYQDNFYYNITKRDGLYVEHEVDYEAIPMRALPQFVSYSNTRRLQQRVDKNKQDIYGTGFPRGVSWYPDFDLYKYILFDSSGDFSGNVKMNDWSLPETPDPPPCPVVDYLALPEPPVGRDCSVVPGGPQPSGCRNGPKTAVRLVVNSHVDYSKARVLLFRSLEHHQFKHFGDVLVFLGGAKENSEPHAAPGRLGQLGVVHVNVSRNSHDLNGFAGLFHHINNSLVRAKAYLYIHDTTTVGPDFPLKFQNLHHVHRNQLWRHPRPHSDIFAFGVGIVELYGSNFDRDITKEDGLTLEHDRVLEGRVPVFPLSMIVPKHKVAWLLRRHVIGKCDVYHTTHPRGVTWYPDWDLFKYVLWDMTGDFQGHVRKNQWQLTN